MAKRIITKKALDEFGKEWVKVLKDELLNNRPFSKNASGQLIRSINYKVIDGKDNFYQLLILSEKYLEYVDKGVSGTEKKYNTPYRYSTKYPPLQSIQRWVQLKGIPEQAAYGIQKSIFRFGLKPTNVINKTIRTIQYKSKWATRWEGEVADTIINDIKEYFKGSI